MASQFFPRGGSAHVAANLALNLGALGHDVRVVSGSVDGAGDAKRFFRGLDVHAVDMTAALTARDPLLAPVPLHPSYEHRPGAPDRIFASLDDMTFEHQVEAWERVLVEAGAAEAGVLHLHHLTPVHEAAARVAPDVPVVGHLHGTELLMLEQGEAWPHAAAWRARMQSWADRCRRLIVLTESHIDRAAEQLDIDAERCVVVPNGFDPARFRPRALDRDVFWRAQLGVPLRRPVFVAVGRFTAVKRLSLLIEAWAALDPDAALVLVGGHPGECENEHPAEAVARTGARNVHLAGWHDHDALPDFFAAADAVVLASVREQFGQVLVEGMACGLPAIAVDAHGPAEIVADGSTGWLVPGDDRDALAGAIRHAIDRPDERRARGERALEAVRERYAWPALAERVAEVYRSADPVAPSAA